MIHPVFASAFQPAIHEIERQTGQTFFESDRDIIVSGSAERLPQTIRLLIFPIGHALAIYEAHQKSEYEHRAWDMFQGGREAV